MRLTGSKGEITASFTYGTYGELLSGDNRLTKFLYNGRCGVTTDDNGLYYMRQRYYNPEIKRFVNQDVLTGSLSNSQSLNRYSYAQGNPVSYTDPFGLSPLSGEFVGATFAHLFFGLLGFVPGSIGVAANLADAVLYAFEGDYLMATASLLGAVTMGFSQIATKCAAQAVKAAKAADIAKQMSLLQKAQKAGFVADLSRTAGGSLYLARSYGQARQIVNKESGLAGTARPGEAYSWEEKLALTEAMAACALSAFGMVSGGMGMSRAANGLRALNGASATAAMADIADGVRFVAGTRIMTAEGGKNIEEIQAGDLVYSKNAETGETGYKKVVQLFQKETTELTHLEAGGVSITTPHTSFLGGRLWF